MFRAERAVQCCHIYSRQADGSEKAKHLATLVISSLCHVIRLKLAEEGATTACQLDSVAVLFRSVFAQASRENKRDTAQF
jgi:hypothetical protein